MRKMLLCLTIILIMATHVSAHTYLKDSNPEDGETVQKPLKEIKLFFETRIEKQSTFELFDENGQLINIDISVAEDTMTGILTNPLSNGSYTVNWKIIGADGHPIEGKFSFEVNVTEESNNEVKSTDNPSKEDQLEESSENTQEKDTSEVEQTEHETDFAVVLIIVILMGIILSSMWWLARRK